MKQQIDNELKNIVVTEAMKENISQATKVTTKKLWKNRALKYAAAFAIVIALGTTSVYALESLNSMFVNEEQLPALDDMKIVDMKKLDGMSDEYGTWHQEFSDYSELESVLGVKLLDTPLRETHDYMIGKVETDNEEYAMIHVENFLIGDTTNYRSAQGEEKYRFEYNGVPYTYDSGEEYYGTISLEIAMILGEEQYASGWNKDYLGMYEFVEQYTSKQGYRVNVVAGTTAVGVDELPDNFQEEKKAVFVADGIWYEVSGRVSIETLKGIVDSMR